MIKSKNFISLFICLTLLQGSYLFSQESEKGHLKRLEFIKKSPLPKKNTQLKKLKVITEQGQITEELYLKQAYGLAINNRDEIYVSDMKNSQIFKFNLEGKLLLYWGRRGQGPGDLSIPLSVVLYRNYIVVNDNGNRRIVFFDDKGNYVKSFKTYRGYNDLAISKEGLIYATPFFVPRKEKRLIDVIDQVGQLVNSFGQFPAGITRLREFWGRIAFNKKRGELYLAYTNFLVVQRYSDKGELIQEFKINHPGMKIKERENKKKIVKPGQVSLFQVIDDIEPKEDGFYVLITYPRIEFLEYNLNGDLVNDYWFQYEEDPGAAKGFQVIERDNNKLFVVIFEAKYSSIYIFSVH